MAKFRQISVILLAVVSLCSCVTQSKMTYFRGIDQSAADSINAKFQPRVDPVIKMGDAVTITVSALDKEAVALYNLPTLTYNTPGSSTVNTTPSLQYYTVDEKGDVEIPVLGKFHILGMKTTEAADSLETLLESQVVDPMVIVTLLNPHVTVMGEVNKPGQYSMHNGYMTLLDALGAAGDMTIYGRRDNVLITRENNGKLEFARLNLNKDEIFSSPYYYLQQNDVVYVSPNKVRAVSSQNLSLWLSMVSTLASSATVIVSVVNVTKK